MRNLGELERDAKEVENEIKTFDGRIIRVCKIDANGRRPITDITEIELRNLSLIFGREICSRRGEKLVEHLTPPLIKSFPERPQFRMLVTSSRSLCTVEAPRAAAGAGAGE